MLFFLTSVSSLMPCVLDCSREDMGLVNYCFCSEVKSIDMVAATYKAQGCSAAPASMQRNKLVEPESYLDLC